MIFNKEILTPISDTLHPSPWNIRYTTFRLGPMFVHFVLKDLDHLPQELMEQLETIEDHRYGTPYEFKRYVVFCIVNDSQAYIMKQSISEEEATVYFKSIVQRLKFGDDVEITDQAGIFESLQLSYRGIKWIWE